MSQIAFSSSSNLPEYLWILVGITPNLASNCSASNLIPRNLKLPFFGGGSSPVPLENMTIQWPNIASVPVKNYIPVGVYETKRFFKDCPSRTKPSIPSATYQWRVHRKITPCLPQNVNPPKCEPGFVLSKSSSVSSSGCPTVVYECLMAPKTSSSCCLNGQAKCIKCAANQDCIAAPLQNLYTYNFGDPSKEINGVMHRWVAQTCAPKGGQNCPQSIPPVCSSGKTLISTNVNLPNGCVTIRYKCV